MRVYQITVDVEREDQLELRDIEIPLERFAMRLGTVVGVELRNMTEEYERLATATRDGVPF